MMRRTMPLLIWPLLVCVAWADQVNLKNGDRITGKVVKKDGAALTFKSDVFGVIAIPWDQVTQLVSDEQLTVVLPDGKMVQGKLATADNKLVVTTATARESVALGETPAIRNADEQRAWERLQNPGLFQLWSGFVDFGASLARGNAETTTMTTGLNASRVTRTDKTALYFNQIYATATVGGETSTAAQQVEPCALRLDDAVTEPRAEDEAQVEVLELVVFPVVEEVHEHARAEVPIVGPSSADRLGRGRRLAADRGGGVDLV